MKNEPLLLYDGLSSIGICLRSFWDIYADVSYQNYWPRDRKLPTVAGSIVAIYSKQGQGSIRLKDGKQLTIDGNSIIWIKSVDIESYGCQGLLWELYWFEFLIYGELNIPFGQAFQIKNQFYYLKQIEELIQVIKENKQRCYDYATSIFSKLLYQWLMLTDDQNISEQNKKIQYIINEMHKRITENWAITDMAKEIGYSEQHFRTLFISYTKQTPKNYYQQIKLALANSLLNKGSLTIAQIAEQLGFSDQFHFSKVFKKTFGVTPSDIKNR